jgi:chemotaxis protein methyltransferase WspC
LWTSGFSLMALTDFENLLKETMGLDSASVGRATIENAVRMRMESLGFKEAEDYWERLHAADDELQELIEAVVVPETWFFRDLDAFTALGRLISVEWLPNHPTAVLRLLSGPCCSGEEPYSMAMALLDAGISPDRLRIDAVDISVRALVRAKLGTYGSNSFRGEDLTFRDRYFERTAKGYCLPEWIRQIVTFHYGNLLSSDFRVDSAPYDVIFCRNVLIYFDRDTQKRVMTTLDRLLAASGFLFVGPSETFLAACSGFTSIDQSMSFAFRKAGSGAKAHARVPRPQLARAAQSSGEQYAPHTLKTSPMSIPSPAPTVVELADLETARRLADAGRLTEAGELCELHLKEQRSSSQAYYLLGLVRDAVGDLQGAAECYRKVLYLDPLHREALLHLALLSEGEGDKGMAERLRGRARRAAKEAGE